MQWSAEPAGRRKPTLVPLGLRGAAAQKMQMKFTGRQQAEAAKAFPTIFYMHVLPVVEQAKQRQFCLVALACNPSILEVEVGRPS